VRIAAVGALTPADANADVVDAGSVVEFDGDRARRRVRVVARPARDDSRVGAIPAADHR
jgi:hypothetical protein